MNWRADAALTASAVPQSSQNADEGAFSAPHFGQRLVNGLPHAAQNFLPVVLSVPHFVQRIATTFRQADVQVSRLDGPIERREAGQRRETAQRADRDRDENMLESDFDPFPTAVQIG